MHDKSLLICNQIQTSGASQSSYFILLPPFFFFLDVRRKGALTWGNKMPISAFCQSICRAISLTGSRKLASAERERAVYQWPVTHCDTINRHSLWNILSHCITVPVLESVSTQWIHLMQSFVWVKTKLWVSLASQFFFHSYEGINLPSVYPSLTHRI